MDGPPLENTDEFLENSSEFASIEFMAKASEREITSDRLLVLECRKKIERRQQIKGNSG